jgi:hypothetical protein
MTAAFFLIMLGIWALYSGWRFYRQVNWDEPAVSTPDYGAMRKREAELQHIQEFLEDAVTQGKLSRTFIEEFNRFCDGERAEIHSAIAEKR